MKINEKIICIPPYISTTWKQVTAIHMKDMGLTISLADGKNIDIPNLSSETIEIIFNSHAKSMESETSFTPNPIPTSREMLLNTFEASPSLQDSPFQIALGSLENGMGSVMQHNPAQASAPNLPPEILQKISAIAKIISADADDISVLPKAEPNCNCFHCQIARTIACEVPRHSETIQDEPVKDEDLQFQQWEIHQIGDKLFTVINRLDSGEKYSVYLGHPVGCTCGQQGCEHMVAVLKS